MVTDRIREDMSVICADDRCIGFVCSVEGDEMLRVTSITAGYGYDHLIPLSWVSGVNKYVFLDKTSSYVAANWETAPLPTGFAGSAERSAGADSGRFSGFLHTKAA
jgi:hypothetical protein